MSTTEQQTVTDKDLQRRLVFAWLDALRSGEFKQAKGYLEVPEGNCCLGVACRVAMRHGVKLDAQPSESRAGATTFNSYMGSLPTEMTEALGLRTGWGAFEVSSLDTLNDEGRTFNEIADIIEVNARALFVNGDEVAGWLEDRKQPNPAG